MDTPRFYRFTRDAHTDARPTDLGKPRTDYAQRQTVRQERLNGVKRVARYALSGKVSRPIIGDARPRIAHTGANAKLRAARAARTARLLAEAIHASSQARSLDASSMASHSAAEIPPSSDGKDTRCSE